MEIEVSQVMSDRAGQALRAAGLRAPLASDTPEQIAAGGDCFSLRTEGGECVFVLRVEGETLWIDGAGATAGSAGMVAAGLQLADQIAMNAGCQEIAFETNRPGLVRESKKQGYEVVGYIMRKNKK